LVSDLGSIRGKPIGPVVSFDGTALHVEEIGNGPTVVMAHGFCLGVASWHHQMRDLAPDHRLVLYDQRGHGLSERPETGDYSLEAGARDLAAIIGECGGDEVVLAGHSMGGMIVLKYCEMFPHDIGERVKALILVDTTETDAIGGMLPGAAKTARPALRLIEEAASRAPGAFDRVRAARGDLMRLLLRLMGFGPKAPHDQVAFVESLLNAVPTEVMVPVVQTLRTMHVGTALEHIDVPVLVVVGSRDRMTPPACARRIATEIPHAQLAVVQGAGHMPMLERPDELNALVRTFLAVPGAAYGGRRLPGDRR
jgi:pimeloyl-ACP methyl ester carboxylesterase